MTERSSDAFTETGGEVRAQRLRVGGRVQAVGFRPFVYRLAREHGLSGWVRNRLGEVEILIQGPGPALERFARALVDAAPPLARPELIGREPATPRAIQGFVIAPSAATAEPRVHVPPDYFACPDCLAEMRDPADRRHRYPFINCTQCGPRYTLITALPYDRPNTTMAGFALCPACRAEYEDPPSRRFHAEPLACPDCGPGLSFRRASGVPVDGTDAALEACIGALGEGAIVAARGIGGYHLLCDARRDATVARLRARKTRPHKPLAVMVPALGDDGLAAARGVAHLTDAEARLLRDPARPIVLVTKRQAPGLAPSIAPGLEEVGLMLPYSPLHHLLLEGFGAPLVATSGNISGEPVLTDPDAAEARLAGIADAFLHHDRPIARPADDSVFRSVGGAPRPLRLGRGVAPLERTLPRRLARATLAVGAQLKNTIALGWEDRVVISPHIGDLGSPRSQEVLERVAADLQSLYGVRAQRVTCDAHPDYSNSRWARRSGLPVAPVLHHHAHASALAGELDRLPAAMIVFTWDGVGYGADGTLWGGEALVGRPGAWQRAASFRPFRLPGGERAAREPWRCALALAWEAGARWAEAPPDTALLHQAWARGLNTPASSAVGRLFDAAAALTGVLGEASFEGQGPMWLEALADGAAEPVALPMARDGRGVWRTDWAPLLGLLTDAAIPVAERAARLHATLAAALLAQARTLRAETGIETVGLTGGVFQNRRLGDLALRALRTEGFEVHLPAALPCNDAAISFGQTVEVAGGD